MALLLAMPTADTTAVKPNHDGLGRLWHDLRHHLGRMQLHDILADRNVLLRAVPAFSARRSAATPTTGWRLCPTAAARIPRRHVRQLRRHGRRGQVGLEPIGNIPLVEAEARYSRFATNSCSSLIAQMMRLPLRVIEMPVGRAGIAINGARISPKSPRSQFHSCTVQ